MHKPTMRLAILAIVLAAGARADAPAKPPSIEEAVVANVADAKWVTPKLPEVPPGLQAALIAGDPKTGPSIGYAKFPPGFVFPAHWHSHAEYAVLIAGKMSLTVDGKAHDLSPGGYAVIPAKTKHQVTCAAGSECILMSRRAGPTDYHFVGKE